MLSREILEGNGNLFVESEALGRRHTHIYFGMFESFNLEKMQRTAGNTSVRCWPCQKQAQGHGGTQLLKGCELKILWERL